MPQHCSYRQHEIIGADRAAAGEINAFVAHPHECVASLK